MPHPANPPDPDPTPDAAHDSAAPAGDPARPDSDAGRERRLMLVKRGQRYVFKCNPGGERELLDQLAAMADDPADDLTWFDAAVLSHQMGRNLGQTLGSLKKAS